MNDLDTAILAAWSDVLPRLRNDPTELARRVGRRQRLTLTRPPRAWCIGLRANDTRIDIANASIVPEDALDPNEPDFPAAHDVRIDKPLLQKICPSVRLDGWGEEVTDVARYLGCRPNSLRTPRKQDLFVHRYVKGLAGKIGANVPILHSDHTLAPNHRLRQRPDRIWGTTWDDLPDQLPDDFFQDIQREPIFQEWRRAVRGRIKPGRVPIDIRGRFDGFAWECPGCKKLVRYLFYAMPPLDMTKLLAQKLAIDDADALPTPPPMFACYKCHRVRFTGRADRNDWNHIIAYLTGGLLYGREVTKPAWYTPDRKRPYRPQLHRPAPRRGQVLRRLMNGWSIRKIAADLQIGIRAVHNHIRILCAHERVPNRHMLARKFRSKHRQPLNQDERALARRKEVQRLILQGRSFKEIMSMLHTDFSTVNRDTWKIYKMHGVSGRKGLAKKLGVKLPDSEGEKIRERMREFREQGMTWPGIAREMGMKMQAVEWHAKVMRKALRAPVQDATTAL
jgi:DNA-binding NarL/FixJ family response regulator